MAYGSPGVEQGLDVKEVAFGCGLKNGIGSNHCFLNALVQSLFRCAPLQAMLAENQLMYQKVHSCLL